MIEFKGEISSKCKEFLLKEETKNSFISTLIACGIFIIPIICAAVFYNKIFIIALPVFIIIPILSTIKPKKTSWGIIIPYAVTIYLRENQIVSSGEKVTEVKNLNQVKNVVDFGEWYKIFFIFPYKSQRFVCQKDLLVQGTIEEFEAVFEGKIVRKK